MLERVRRGRSSIQVIARDMAALIFFIRKNPRTIAELSKLSGQSQDKVMRTLGALVEEGLISKSDEREQPFGVDDRPQYSYANPRARHVYAWVDLAEVKSC